MNLPDTSVRMQGEAVGALVPGLGEGAHLWSERP